jgi:hypothetical protein
MCAWLEAQGTFADELATFQATQPTCTSYDMPDVLRAIAPAQQQGFAYSITSLQDGFQLRVMHRSGWDLISTLEIGESPWKALALLMGVPVSTSQDASAVQPEQIAVSASEPACPMPAPVLAAVPEPAEEPDEFADADLMGEGTPETPVLPEDRAALSESDRETCLSLVRALTQEQRKAFTIAFRSHFNVDKNSRTIAPHIVQVQHQKFIQTYVDELELAGVAA